MQLSQILSPLRKTFDELFAKTFDLKKTSQFLSNVQVCCMKQSVSSITCLFLSYLLLVSLGCGSREELEKTAGSLYSVCKSC